MGEETLKTFHNTKRQVGTILHTKIKEEEKKKKTQAWIKFLILNQENANVCIHVRLMHHNNNNNNNNSV